MALIKAAIDLKKPIFAICRGMQILNVTYGGTLYQDISYAPGEHIKHCQIGSPYQATHSIKIDKHSTLFRMADKLNIIYDVDESLYNFQIPSLIIQPLVENSIKHGILKKKENGCVKIIVKKIDKDIEVIIEDDGVGIEQTVIDNLDKQIQENIGLKNVHQRLKLLYGEGLDIYQRF